MLKFFSKRMNNKKGFTLIELIVVIAILAILALIAIPRIGQFRTRAAVSSHNANVRTLESAASMYLAENGMPTGLVTWNKETNETGDDGWGSYIATWPTIPKGLKDGDDAITDPYSVEIATNGEVEVKPILIDTDD